MQSTGKSIFYWVWLGRVCFYRLLTVVILSFCCKSLPASFFDRTTFLNPGLKKLFFESEPAPLVKAVVEPVSCYNGNDGRVHLEVISSFPPFRFYWNDGVQGAQRNNLAAGTYFVTVIDNAGAKAQTRIDIVQPEPITIQKVDSSHPKCALGIPGFVTVEANGGNGNFRYYWETGEISNTLHSFTGGPYALTVTDEKGCRKVVEVEMEGLNLSIFVDGVILDSELETDYLCPQDSVQITIQANWQLESTSWLSSLNLSCMNCFTTVLLPKDDFWLHVEATDIFGCSEEVYTTVSVNKGCYVLIPDSFTPNGDGVGDFFFISADQKEYRLLNFRIFSQKGELIYEGGNNCNLPGYPECGWNGMDGNKPAISGKYTYLIELYSLTKEKSVLFTGNVALIQDPK